MPLKLPSAEQFLFLANILADRFLFAQGHDAAVKKILIVKWDEIGDMATATHVFRLLREDYPGAEITLLCKPFVKSLIAHDPHINHFMTDINLFNQRYDLVVEMRGTWKTLLKSIVYKAKYRVGRAEVRARNKGQQLHEYDTNTAIVQPILKSERKDEVPVLYFSAEDERVVDEFLKAKGIGRFALFHVGARRVLRQWSLDRYAKVAKYLHEQYGLAIVFAGTEEDEAQIDIVKKQLDFEAFNFTKGFTLSQFSALCSRTTLYIGNESGPLQIAAVFKVPLIGIFGPGVPNVFYPKNANSRVLHHVLPCNPCDQIHCVQPENPCINMVTELEVLGAIADLMQ